MFSTRIIDIKEKDRYNDFVTAHPKGHFLQLWEWGQVKKGMGWEPLPLVLEEDGEIKASLLILKRRIPLPFFKKCIFYSPRGPVVDVENRQLCQLLLAGASRVAHDEGAIFLKIDPDVPKEQSGVASILTSLGGLKNETGVNFEGVQPNFVFRLDLNPEESTLLGNMHSKWRYNIRLAQKKGVKIREARDRQDLEVFYKILLETATRDRFLIRGYEYFQWIWDYLVEGGYARIFLAEYQDQVISGTLALILGSKAWYLYGASSNDQRHVMPNYLIQWEMIRWARNHGCTLYDFRGVSGDLTEDNPLYGLYRFKKGFSGQLTEFIGEWDFIYSSFFHFLWTRVLPLYQKIGRRKARQNQGD